MGRTISAISDCESRTGRAVSIASSMHFLFLAATIPGAISISWRRASFQTAHTSPNTTPDNTRPFFAHARQRGYAPIASTSSQTPHCRAQPEDSRVHKRSGIEPRTSRSRGHTRRWGRHAYPWPRRRNPLRRSAPHPRPALSAAAGNPRRSRDCIPATLAPKELLLRVPAQCSTRSIRIPRGAALDAATRRSPISPLA